MPLDSALVPIAPEDDFHHPRLVVQVAVLFLVILLALAVTQSGALVTLTYDWPPSRWTERVIALAEIWHGWMETLGPADWTSDIQATMSDTREWLVSGD